MAEKKNFNEESNVKEDDISIEEKTINEECNCDLPYKECCSDEEEKDISAEDENKSVENEENSAEQQDEISQLKEELARQTKKSEEYLDMLQRKAAEFDNFRKRTNKEKEAIYYDAVSECIGELLPVIDNLEKAVDTCKDDMDPQKILEGMQMILKQFKDCLERVGVEEIKALGEKFNPDVHDAVMHSTDDTKEENIIVEEFRKGYKVKDRIIRHSMVKVVN